MSPYISPRVRVNPHPNPKQERRLFLTFVWGRNRLPLTEQDWGDTVMRVHELNTAQLRGSADQFFPVSHTCSLPIDPAPTAHSSPPTPAPAPEQVLLLHRVARLQLRVHRARQAALRHPQLPLDRRRQHHRSQGQCRAAIARERRRLC